MISIPANAQERNPITAETYVSIYSFYFNRCFPAAEANHLAPRSKFPAFCQCVAGAITERHRYLVSMQNLKFEDQINKNNCNATTLKAKEISEQCSETTGVKSY
jgi:hypothetical protein